MKIKQRYKQVIFISAVALILSVSWYYQYRIYAINQDQLKDNLFTVLATKLHLLNSWTEQHESNTRMWANTPSTRLAAQELVRIANASKSGPRYKSLQNAPPQQQLQDWFANVRENTHYQDFFIVDRQGYILASNSTNTLRESQPLSRQQIFFDKIWQGHAALSQPEISEIPLPDAKGKLKAGLARQYVGAPVYDNRQRIIAALVYLLDPLQGFNNIFTRHNIHYQGEVFVFNQQGFFLSTSRFDNQMRQSGLLKDRSSMLHLKVKLPGFRSSATGLNQLWDDNIALHLDQYNNYRNMPVIGAWAWNKDLNLGIAVEFDAAAAKQNLTQVTVAMFGLSVLLLGITSLFFYITQLQRKQRITQALLPSLVEASTEAMLSVNKQGRVIYANSRVSDLLGYEPDEIIGNSIEMLIPEALRDIHQHHRHQFMKNPQRRPMGNGMELHAQHKNGDVVLVEVSLNPYSNKDDSGVTVSLRDVSVQEQLKSELSLFRGRLQHLVEKRTAELDASRKELESYSYTIAHDLRSPLRSIAGFSQILLDDDGTQKKQERDEALQKIIQASKRMAVMIDDILELSRITRKAINYEDVNLSLLVDDVIFQIREKYPERKIYFKVEQGLIVNGDRRLLRMVIENLIENAVKYTRLKTKPMVEFGHHTHHDVDAYFVRDNGIGFDMAYRNQLFKPFYRLHATELYEGEGIGLATAQRIIHRHGGRIWASSEKNVGSTFYFTVPNLSAKNVVNIKSRQESESNMAAH